MMKNGSLLLRNYNEKKRRYDLLIFDWNGTLSTAHLPLKHYGESQTVPNLYPGTKSTLKQLHDRGYILAIASAASTQKLQFETSHHEIAQYFSCLQGGEGLYHKPDPEMLNYIIAKCGAQASRSLMIGDTSTDMSMAMKANVDAIAVCYGQGNQEELIQYHPIGLIKSISGLLKWLNEGNRG